MSVTRSRSAPSRLRTRRQAELMDRLVALMTAEGFSHLTLDDIAERLHCSKTTLYALAASKSELVLEVVKQYFRDSVVAVEAAVTAADGSAERVVAYLRAVAWRLALLSRNFLDDLASYGPAAETYRQNTAIAADRIRELIADGIARGDLRDVNAAFTAETVAATMLAIQRGDVPQRLQMTDAEAYEELATLVVQVLTTDHPTPNAG